MAIRSGETWHISDASGDTTAIFEPAAPPSQLVFVCAHGAGGHMGDRSILQLTAALRQQGVGTVRFNFFYRARGSGRPDSMPRLLACFEAVVAQVRRDLRPDVLILGGRSMGGRAASVFVSDGASCDGLLLLAYPLHPPGHPEKLRAAHLTGIVTPVLCINGTRDAFCDRAVMQRALSTLGTNWCMHWVDGADHGFHVLKRTGRADSEVLAEIVNACRTWLHRTSKTTEIPRPGSEYHEGSRGPER